MYLYANIESMKQPKDAIWFLIEIPGGAVMCGLLVVALTFLSACGKEGAQVAGNGSGGDWNNGISYFCADGSKPQHSAFSSCKCADESPCKKVTIPGSNWNGENDSW